MRIIFLDFDGVLMTLRTKVADQTTWSGSEPDPLVLKLLWRCCAANEQSGKPIRIVLSTAWRSNELICRDKLGHVECWLHGGQCKTGDRGNRSLEIADWLAVHPEVTDYRILDDEDHQWTDAQRQRWLSCHPSDGMMAEEMHALAEWAGLKALKSSAWPEKREKLEPAEDSKL